ncbi:MAG TPA: hypothetical protein VHV29_02150 [Terriglobales bacterium]|jgi:phage FluMu protein Com|nr:hypothetical protein [Terriglobales bacterium]
MKFQAVKTDLADVAIEGHVRVPDVKCPQCPTVYQLWAPVLETEQVQVEAQTKWLREYLAKKCPDHPEDVIKTPDRPE